MLRNALLTNIAAIAIATSAFANSPSNAKDIMDTAIDAGNFTTFLAAIETFGMTEALKSQGPFTIFAPTDEAFAALSPETLEELLSNPEALASVLSNHVVYGKVMSVDLYHNMTAATAGGTDVSFLIEGDVMVNEAVIMVADIEATNGVIHSVDAVILPPS